MCFPCRIPEVKGEFMTDLLDSCFGFVAKSPFLLLFEDGDLDGLSLQLKRAITDSNLRNRLISGGRNTALVELEIEQTCERYERYFHSLLKAGETVPVIHGKPAYSG